MSLQKKLRHWASVSLAGGRRRKPRASIRRSMHLEALESRELMSCSPGGPFAQPADGRWQTLRISDYRPYQATISPSQVFSGAIQVELDTPTGKTCVHYRNVRDLKIEGSNYNDVLINNTGLRMVAHGNGGADIIRGGSSSDILDGDAGNDRISGGGGNDILRGGNGDDRLEGGNGNDTLKGESGNDTLNGNSGSDRLYGGYGDDTIYLGIGDTRADRLGNDRVITVGQSKIRVDDAATVLEGNSGQTTTMTFHVRRTGNLSTTASVEYYTADGTAKLTDNDYQRTRGKLVFGRGESDKTVRVKIVGDNGFESDESLYLKLRNPSTGATIVDGRATGTIQNDDPDTSSPVRLSVADAAAVSEGSNGQTTTMTFAVTRSGDLNRTVAVHYATEDGTARAADGDYRPTSGTLSFRPGETRKNVRVQINGDNKVESDESVHVRLSNATNGATIVDDRATGTIHDGTIVPPPQLRVADALAVTEGDTGQTHRLTYNVTRFGDTTKTVSVEYYTQDGSATVADGDYRAAQGVLTFRPGQTSKPVRVMVQGDVKDEKNESVILRLRNATGGARIVDDRATGTIRDDDPKVELPTISIADAVVTEGNAGVRDAVVQVRLSKTTDRTVSVIYGIEPVSAVMYEDFQPVTGQVTFAPGETVKQIRVPIHGDLRMEADETLRVHLRHPSQATLADGTAVVTIRNDEPALRADRPGVYRGRTWMLDVDGRGGSSERNIAYGLSGDVPLAGDFNGDGREDLVVARRNGARGGLDWYVDHNADGTVDRMLQYGLLHDTPVAGDWNGDGKDDLGVVRDNGRGGLDWFLDLNGDGMFAEKVLSYGLSHDTPVVGDWNGDGKDDLGAVRNNGRGGLDWYFDLLGNGGAAEKVRSYGLAGDIPVAGNWNGDRRDDMGVVRQNGQWLDWYLDLDNGADALAEEIVLYGLASDIPVVGKWS